MGGVPKDPAVVEGWLRAKTGVTDSQEIQTMMRRTMIEQGTWRENMSPEEIEEASRKVAEARETAGFKRDPEGGLYIESRQIKALLKEATNILYAGDKWGATRKGPKSFLAERVFVEPDMLWLGRTEPDGVHLAIGHPSGPQGPKSTLGYHEYTQRSEIEFEVKVTRDSIEPEWWADIWVQSQELGLGALRSQGFGKFDLLEWEAIEHTSAAPRRSRSRP
jgi:hypothetical protein